MRTAKERDITEDEAVNLIIQEWGKTKGLRRSKVSTESCFLDTLANKIEDIDKLVDDLVLKLKENTV